MLRTTLLAAILLAGSVLPAWADFDPQAALQLADYIAVDYPEAVVGGAVVSETEYEEMQEFSTRIVNQTRDLEPRGPIVETAEQLAALIEAKVSADQIAAASRTLRERILAEHPVALTPATLPDLDRGALLYQQECASCHGPIGRGDGPLAKGLEPSPTDFHDRARAEQRSLYGLYSTITLGVEGAGMASFSHLPDTERWSLAFYVGGLAATEEELAASAALLARDEDALAFDMSTMTSSTLREIDEQFGPGMVALALYLRRHPQPLYASQRSPFGVAREQTELAVTKFRAGERVAAATAALSAYLDGFELVENNVSAVDDELKRRIEADMFAMRKAVDARGATLQDVEQRAATVLARLGEAEHLLAQTELTPTVVFTSSLAILLREGLEAILILAAIAAFMIKTGRRDALTYLHIGWVAALALGVATWAISTWLLEISGATRELTEGLTALFAALVLFYVGFWMHGKLSAQRWSEFLRENVGKALEGGTLWTLTLVSFIAVYREVFETVLFYQALWTQTGSAGQTAIFAGAGTAAALLVLSAWLIFKLGVRLPLRQFFGVSAAVMIVLAVVFAGKGVAALQEAGKLPSDAIAYVPQFETLGIYPNWQSIGLQVAMVAIAIGLVLYNGRVVRAHD
jgi:high-affinity iron transporter